MRRQNPNSPSPCLIMGDFNEILNLIEKFGKATRLFFLKWTVFVRCWKIASLATWVMLDPNTRGATRGRGDSLQKRGRAELLLILFSPLFFAIVSYTVMNSHCPKLFQFEVAWSQKQECKDMIKSAWLFPGEQSSSLRDFKEGLAHCREKLQSWVKSNARNSRKAIKANMGKLRLLQSIN
ncbi:unnamed protein product [Fraxinus pennsylvanica]|uniref:Uncharacterized protein n=1 Tax=Fraxinus pennsylvanica TaxID=56036 RepID=A0AAD1YUC8_9LAMI|nr:unnamed protein product [Fraxinus pennsylvanica]